MTISQMLTSFPSQNQHNLIEIIQCKDPDFETLCTTGHCGVCFSFRLNLKSTVKQT